MMIQIICTIAPVRLFSPEKRGMYKQKMECGNSSFSAKNQMKTLKNGFTLITEKEKFTVLLL